MSTHPQLIPGGYYKEGWMSKSYSNAIARVSELKEVKILDAARRILVFSLIEVDGGLTNEDVILAIDMVREVLESTPNRLIGDSSRSIH